MAPSLLLRMTTLTHSLSLAGRLQAVSHQRKMNKFIPRAFPHPLCPLGLLLGIHPQTDKCTRKTIKVRFVSPKVRPMRTDRLLLLSATGSRIIEIIPERGSLALLNKESNKEAKKWRESCTHMCKNHFLVLISTEQQFLKGVSNVSVIAS